ncbi:MAG: hypothetical protein WKG01_02230 [Kofleriaceae bacterium]
MRGKLALPLLLAWVGCKAQVEGGTPIDGSTTDGTIDRDTPDALILGAWGMPAPVGGASDPTLQEDDGTLSYSQREIVFARQNAADNNRKDLYWAARATPQDTFGIPIKLALSLTGSAEETPRFSDNDLTLYFSSSRDGNLDVYSVARPATGTPWTGQGTSLTGLTSGAVEKWFAPCDGGRYLVILGTDVAEGTVPDAPTVVTSLSSAASETGTFVTKDCRTAYFASNVGGTNQIYLSTRTAVTDPWPAPTPVTDFAALGGDQQDPWISPDQRTFVLASNAAGGQNDIYISTR